MMAVRRQPWRTNAAALIARFSLRIHACPADRSWSFDMTRFASFSEFYPFYLSEHSNRMCRRMHFIGSSLVVTIAVFAVVTGQLRWLWLMPVAGYGFAWIGHYVYQKNQPATFKHPLYSLQGDWVMYGHMLRGKLQF
jgi:hypothetical protein